MPQYRPVLRSYLSDKRPPSPLREGGFLLCRFLPRRKPLLLRSVLK
jgi:hypothetical protein